MADEYRDALEAVTGRLMELRARIQNRVGTFSQRPESREALELIDVVQQLNNALLHQHVRRPS